MPMALNRTGEDAVSEKSDGLPSNDAMIQLFLRVSAPVGVGRNVRIEPNAGHLNPGRPPQGARNQDPGIDGRGRGTGAQTSIGGRA